MNRRSNIHTLDDKSEERADRISRIRASLQQCRSNPDEFKEQQVDLTITLPQPELTTNTPMFGLSSESPNAHLMNDSTWSSGSNIDLSHVQDIPFDAQNNPLLSSIEIQEVEEEENISTVNEKQEEEEQDMAAKPEKQDSQENEDNLELALECLNKADAIAVSTKKEMAEATIAMREEFQQTIKDTEAKLEAVERGWISNIGENIQHLTSLASTLTNACITFVSTAKSVTVFIFSNWTGILLAIVIIIAGWKIAPHLAKFLFKMLKRLLLGPNTGPILQIPESFYNRMEQVNASANRYLIVGTAAFSGITAVLVKIFRK